MKVFLKYAFIAAFLTACKEKHMPSPAIPDLYPEPLTAGLDTVKGYVINPVTGDSIKPFLNSSGTEIKTGIALPFHGRVIDSSNIQPAIVSKPVVPSQVIIPTNVHPLPQQLRIIPVDKLKPEKIKVSDMKPPVITMATGKTIPFREPEPLKALPMRYKDDATSSIQYLNVEQGLNYSYAYDVMEDRRGNLWFGMDVTGLTKYNGNEFINYTTKEGLTNNTVVALLEQSNGNIWIGTSKGVTLYDGRNFIQFTKKEGFTDAEIAYIREDKKGNIWFSSLSGAYKYDGKNFTHYTSKQGLPSDSVNCCFSDSKGNMWFSNAKGGFSCFDGESFTNYILRGLLPNSMVVSIAEDNKGNLWFCDFFSDNSDLMCFNGHDLTLYSKQEGLSTEHTLFILNGRSGNTWVGSLWKGLNKFDGKNFVSFNLSEGLTNYKIRKFTEDSNGNLWICTEGGGINKLNANGFSYPFPDQLLGSTRIRPIAKDSSGNLWLGTDGERLYRSVAGMPGHFFYYTAKNGLAGFGQRSLYAMNNGDIWVGTMADGGVCRFTDNRFINYGKKQGPHSNSVNAIFYNKKGQHWFGTSNEGISIYNDRYFTQVTEKDGLSSNAILEIKEDSHHNTWIGTERGGLIKYDGTNMIIYTEKQGFFSNTVTSVMEDKEGLLWFGTQGAGVCSFDGKTFTYYTERQGLSNNNVWSLIQDSSGNIWAGTDKGLNCLLKIKNKYVIYSYGQEDGIKSPDFNLHSACFDNNNRIWWGTGKNVITRDMNVQVKTADVRSLKLDYIKLNDVFYDYYNLSDSMRQYISYKTVQPFTNCPEALQLSYEMNHVSFHFSAIDWSAPTKIKYSYRMVGLNEEWSKPSAEPMVDYRNLGYGDYEFQLAAIGQSQQWTPPLIYRFSILPAWWQSWWFRALLIAVITMILFVITKFVYNYQLRKQKIALEKDLAVQYERQRISAEMHDDIGAGLSGIRLLTEMTKNKIKDEQASEEIDKIYKSIGEISSRMKEVIWSLNTENDHLSNLALYIQKQARQWLENYPAKLSINTSENIPDKLVSGETRRNIFLVIKEAIHNIIKHSDATEVSIQISFPDNSLQISISDNGKGLDINEPNTAGNGMKNMKQRIQKLNGNIFIDNKEGLTLTFEIPIQPA